MLGKISNCEECSSELSNFYCQDCEQYLCNNCNEQFHRGGKRKSHLRIPTETKCQENIKVLEKNTNEGLFSYNINNQPIRETQEIHIQNTLRLFWDFQSSSLNLNQFKETAERINAKYPYAVKIYVYGKDLKNLEGVFTQYNIEYRSKPYLSDQATMINDVIQDFENYKKNIIITYRSYHIKQNLPESYKSHKNSTLNFIIDLENLNELSPDEIQYSSNIKCIKPTSDKDFYKLTHRKAAASENSLELSMISYLKNLAYEGKIIHDINELTDNLVSWMNISKINALELINTGCKLGKLLSQVKKIGNIESNIISLKIDKLDQECLLWVLRSLKNDEMISTEKAIQSRLKEAFDFKPAGNTWTSFIDYVLKPKRVHHQKSLSETRGFSFFTQNDEKKTRNFSFCSKKIQDLVSGVETYIIYPTNEEWISYDQYIKSGDVFKIKQTRDWELFIKFFNKHFDTEHPEDQAISGGRYGCAQYLKVFAETPLKNSTLGKLSYMIQLAIDEDLLRYHKTLLVWVPVFDKKCKEDKLQLFSAKKLVVEALAQCPEGISLAQLPTVIKEKLPANFDLSKLGFAKLKDLILEIPDIELTSKGKNHPFVRLVKVNPPSLECLCGFISQKLEEQEEFPVFLSQIDNEILEKFGFNFRWSWFKSRNLNEFLKNSQDFFVTENNEVKNVKLPEKHHSYNSSTTSDALSNYYYSDYQTEDTFCKPSSDKLEEIAIMQTKYIQQLLDEDEYQEDSYMY
ncbi:hypothetical protein SteCoe_3850 [Stentor coeruleus]|uniref:B box-type domain-containing protein n=1 Tax=Stentor coeruleus TaxID=5963 RepID=A0A1R2CW78_9CILI|nr:hypothetical protein SteCoe_3850 [Stentor coeruleus]